MTIGAVTTLVDVLSNIDELPWQYALFIPKENPNWLPDMPAMVLDPDETDDPDDDPEEAKNNGLTYALTMSSVKQVVENLQAQTEKANLDIQINALRYYFDNDAFITLTN